jgi:hypothetical protein
MQGVPDLFAGVKRPVGAVNLQTHLALSLQKILLQFRDYVACSSVNFISLSELLRRNRKTNNTKTRDRQEGELVK